MRADMAQLLVERGRIGNRWLDAGHRRRRRERRDVRREGMKGRDWSGGFDEYLAPLRRFLRSRVGRPWDDVYSEIRARVRLSRTVDYHIWQHLQWEVERHVPVVDGVPRPKGYWTGLWVCPLSGRLRLLPRRRSQGRRRGRRVATGPAAGLIREDAAHILARVDGVWYRFTVEALAVSEVPRREPQTLLDRLDAVAGHPVTVVAKRQLGKRDLRRHGLRGGPGR